MTDCSKCEHSVANNPDNAGRNYEDMPCAECRVKVHPCAAVSLGSQFEHPSPKTYKILEKPEYDPVIEAVEKLGQILRDGCMLEEALGVADGKTSVASKLYHIMTFAELRVLECCSRRDWAFTLTEIGDDLGISKQAAHKTINKIKAKVKEMQND